MRPVTYRERTVDGVQERECIECKRWQTMNRYPKMGKGYRGHCKSCQGKRQKRSTVSRRAYLHVRNRELLRIHGCVECGEKDPDMLEWDHLPERGDKVQTISHMIWKCYSDENIDAERAKCEVVCANHHKKRTRARAGHLEQYDILPRTEWRPCLPQ